MEDVASERWHGKCESDFDIIQSKYGPYDAFLCFIMHLRRCNEFMARNVVLALKRLGGLNNKTEIEVVVDVALI